ncbi:MAG TPA: hypothetical protein VJ695_06520 [Nitrososphaera sp.]|nr:hypothetical protein [Nitrososphaera sp.]
MVLKNERTYLAGSKEFTAKQRRDIRYRLNKKLRRRGAAELRDGDDDDDDGRRSSLVRRVPPTDRVNERVKNIEENGWAGSELNQRSPPCQGSLLANIDKVAPEQTNNQSILGVDRDFKSCPLFPLQGGHRLNSESEEWSITTPTIIIDWQQFHQFLLQRMTAKTAEDRIQYAKRYVEILANNRNACNQLLSATPNKRIHIMKALSSVARFTGRSDQWRQMRQQYQLSWSTGTEKMDAFTRFFDDSRSLDVLLQWLREAIQVLPSRYANLLLFCTLTGMRGSECIEAVRLLRSMDITSDQSSSKEISRDTHRSPSYYNSERQILQHYLYPNIFIRRTKAIYISIVNDHIIGVAQKVEENPSLIGLKRVIMRRKLSMNIKYCRKIHASWLHHRGISSDLIDALQGRISKNIFLRHYLTPSADYKGRILEALSELQKQLLTN